MFLHLMSQYSYEQKKALTSSSGILYSVREVVLTYKKIYFFSSMVSDKVSFGLDLNGCD